MIILVPVRRYCVRARRIGQCILIGRSASRGGLNDSHSCLCLSLGGGCYASDGSGGCLVLSLSGSGGNGLSGGSCLSLSLGSGGSNGLSGSRQIWCHCRRD